MNKVAQMPGEDVAPAPAKPTAPTQQSKTTPTQSTTKNKEAVLDKFSKQYGSLYNRTRDLQEVLYYLGKEIQRDSSKFGKNTDEAERIAALLFNTGKRTDGPGDGLWGQNTADAIKTANELLGTDCVVGPAIKSGKWFYNNTPINSLKDEVTIGDETISYEKLLEKQLYGNISKLTSAAKAKGVDIRSRKARTQQAQQAQQSQQSQSSNEIDSIQSNDISEKIEDGNIKLNASDLVSFRNLLDWAQSGKLTPYTGIDSNPPESFWRGAINNLWIRANTKNDQNYKNMLRSLNSKLNTQISKIKENTKNFDKVTTPIPVDLLDGQTQQQSQQRQSQGPTQNVGYQSYEGGNISAAPTFPIQRGWIDVDGLRNYLAGENIKNAFDWIDSPQIRITDMNLPAPSFIRQYMYGTNFKDIPQPLLYLRDKCDKASDLLDAAWRIYQSQKPDPDLARAAWSAVSLWKNLFNRLGRNAEKYNIIQNQK
jgi:hypothetical protein